MEQALEAGRTLGRYRIVSRLARGGMAEVWLAELHAIEGFRRRVVLKTIHPNLAQRPEYVKMFINEAAIAARLNHPNIVSVFDLGYLHGTYFIAMDYIPGRSLRDIARKAAGKQLPIWAVVHAAAEVCRGLQYVHDFTDESGVTMGLVHCDVSPENVVVSFAGNTTLVDFGVATAAFAGPEDPDIVKGKLRYIAPERITGGSSDRRGDIYALGVMIYELLTGERVYEGGTAQEVLARAAVGNPRRPRSIRPEIPEALEALILRTLAPSPEIRPAEAAEMESELLRHFDREPDAGHRQRELARYICSLFPDAVEIPSDVRRDLERPSPTSGAWLAAPPVTVRSRTVPPARGLSPPPTSNPATVARTSWPSESDEPRTEVEELEELSINLDELDDWSDVASTAAAIANAQKLPLAEAPPDEEPSPPPAESAPLAVQRPDSGVRRIAEPASIAPAVAAAEAGEPLDAWSLRRPHAELQDVFSVRSHAYSGDVFASRRSVEQGAEGRLAAGGTVRAWSSFPAAFASSPRSRSSAPASARPTPDPPPSREAARHFDAGLRHCREQRHAAALAEWEAAVDLDPTQSTYRVNLRKLKGILAQRDIDPHNKSSM